MTDERPSIGWMEKNWRVLVGLALGGGALAFVFQTVNPDTVRQFAVQQEKLACDRRIHDLFDVGKWCHANSAVQDQWKCWVRK